MLATEAFVSGSLGQAIFRDDGVPLILDAPDAEPREALPNEIYWFRHAPRELALAHPEGLPVPIETVRTRLDEEIRFFSGLDGLLVGMDRDFSSPTRRRAVCRAEMVLSASDSMARRIRERFLIPANTQEWDPSGGLTFALETGCQSAANCYRPLAEGLIDRLADEIAAAVLEKFGSGLEAAQKREAIVRSGIFAELALIEAQADRVALSRMFRRSEFPKLTAADPSGQILTKLVRNLESRVEPSVASEPSAHAAAPDTGVDETGFEPSDPIEAAAERAVAHYERRRPPKGGQEDLPGIQREIDWIGDRLKSGEIARAEKALVTLIDRQYSRSRRADLVKTLTAVADHGRTARLFDWTWRLLTAVDQFGPDCGALCVRAETLRDLGRPDEALASLEATMERFPQDVVARTAYAETLRDLGRPDEALASLEATMERFPQNEVARTAYAETLRDVGRYEEALAAFQETMRRFPQDEVARTAYAHLLAELGRITESEALLAPAAARLRNGHDWIAAHILAMAHLRDGRTKEALAGLERGAQSCPFPQQRKYFVTALPLAMLADHRADDAARQLAAIIKDPTLSL